MFGRRRDDGQAQSYQGSGGRRCDANEHLLHRTLRADVCVRGVWPTVLRRVVS